MPGRFGSGPKRNPARARQRVEDCPIVIDIRRLLPGGCAAEARGIIQIGAHSLTYQIVGETRPAVELAFFVVKGAVKIARCQWIELIASWPRFEGCGLWFRCSGCGRRVAKLYLPTAGSWFSCRRCSGLQYRSAQEHDARVDKLRRDPQRVLGILYGKIAVGETERSLAVKAIAR